MSSSEVSDDDFESADEGELVDIIGDQSSSVQSAAADNLNDFECLSLADCQSYGKNNQATIPPASEVAVNESTPLISNQEETPGESHLDPDHRIPFVIDQEKSVPKEENNSLIEEASLLQNPEISGACIDTQLTDIPTQEHSTIDHESSISQNLPEIITKISTRQHARNRTKPQLKTNRVGKKLGAIRIPQTQSIIPEIASSEPIKNEMKADEQEEGCLKQELQTKSEIDPQGDDKSGGNTSVGGWGWFNPPKSLMSSVSALTSQILSTVETGLNIPDPEELAREEMETTDILPEATEEPQQAEKSLGFSQLMGGVGNLTRFVENTSSMVFSTGLDTLELLGKKTFTALQQSDPGLVKTKSVLLNPGSNDFPSLSQVLKEAKESKDIQEKEGPENVQSLKSVSQQTPKLTVLFENYNGLIHLEALEMLSQQCNSRIASQMHRLTSQRRAVVDEIKQLCFETCDTDDDSETDEFNAEEFEKSLTDLIKKIGLHLPVEKFIEAFRKGMDTNTSSNTSSIIFSDALNSLAEVTSLAVELMHKCAELLLVPRPSNCSPADGIMEAEVFQKLTFSIVRGIVYLGNHFANQIIRNEAQVMEKTSYSTDIFYETSNCGLYLHNGLKLLAPVLQSRTFL